jgi:RHS repeat-associated protein
VDEQVAAAKAAVHANTPATSYFDTLGRPFLRLTRNRFVRDSATVNEAYYTRVELDIEGNQRAVRDAITQKGDALGRVVMRYEYDLFGNRIRQASMEAGRRWTLNDVAGMPIRGWDSRGHTTRTEYDPGRRPVRVFVTGADSSHPSQELLTERLVYGEQHPDSVSKNLRGRASLHLDQAGVVTNTAHDFKGNPLGSSRRIAKQYRNAVSWAAADGALPQNATATFEPVALEAVLSPSLEADTFTSSTTYDALNRTVTLTTPDNSVVRSSYNEASLLERIDANLRGATDRGQPVWTPFVKNIDYDAKGQRTKIVYGSGATAGHKGVTTTYSYDPLTLRLARLTTQRDAAAFSHDCPTPPVPGWPGCQLQDLQYTYDPVGNITHIADGAQQAIFFRNTRIEPSSGYTYDALYRLIEATGREHLGQLGGAPIPHSHDDAARVGSLLHPHDGPAMGVYAEQYGYDAVGNILEMRHTGSDPAHVGWKRTYVYDEASLTEPGKTSNRLSTTTVDANNISIERYRHDTHGNITRMPHLGGADPNTNMHWDYKDQLTQTEMSGGGTVYYVYDSAGQRVRKVWEKGPGITEERIYLGSFELFRRSNGKGKLTLQRETLHVMDDKQRVALVETRTSGISPPNPGPGQLVRYQLSNHLGSANLELDDEAQIISYEEYTPYGSTSYQAVLSHTETPKRYRFTSKERDEESGLYYYSARYYAPWLARWANCDPTGLQDGPNLYSAVRCNPIRFVDPHGTQTRPAKLDLPEFEWRPPPSQPLPDYRPPRPPPTSWSAVESLVTNVAGVALGQPHEVVRASRGEPVSSEEWLSAAPYIAIGTVTSAAGLTTKGLGLAKELATAREASLAYGVGQSVARAGVAAEASSAAEATIPRIRSVYRPPAVVSEPRTYVIGPSPERPTALGAHEFGPIREPKIIDANVLVKASTGNINALAGIRSGDPRVTYSQIREFFDVSTEVQQVQRAQFLVEHSITPLSPRHGQLTSPDVSRLFWRIAKLQGAGDTTADAALVIHARETGFPIVTGDARLRNLVENTLGGVKGVSFQTVKW